MSPPAWRSLWRSALSFPKNILLVTYGSHGDLHPYLAMGRVLRGQGARVTVATHPPYRDQVEREGLNFVALPPGPDELPLDETWARRSNRPIRGMKYVLKKMVLPHFDEAERRFTAAARGQDLIITHFMTLFAPAVAESLGIPWLSCALSPAVMFSAHDPPALGVLPFLPRLKRFGPVFIAGIYRLLALPSFFWFTKIHRQRRRLMLPRLTRQPLFQYASPHGTLALFPPWFAAPQADWPTRTRSMDFPLFRVDDKMTDVVAEFLRAGDPPIVFTLGTAVCLMKSDFFEIAHATVRARGCRAVFVVGPRPPANVTALRADPNVVVVGYENFAPLFAAARVIVHPVGINTTAQALTSGRPQVCVPFAHDQFDNARRVVELGAGVCLPAGRLSVARLSAALDRCERAHTARGFRAPPSNFAAQLVRAITDLTRVD